MSRNNGTVILVSDSPLGDSVSRLLTHLKYQVLTPKEWRENQSLKNICGLIFCMETSFKEKRSPLKSIEQLNSQWESLMEKETHEAFKLTIELLPVLHETFKATKIPSTIVFLGSKMVRSPNSPNQVIPSVVKRAVQAFCGSMFFEKRVEGLRLSCINPSPQVPNESIAQSLVFPFLASKTSCIEALDLTTIKAFPGEKKYGACFVTGGSKGIGKSIAIRLAKEFNMPMGILARDEKALIETSNELSQYLDSNKIYTFQFDVRNQDKLKSAIDFMAERFGGISVLVCSAGINRRANAVLSNGTKFASSKIWQDIVDINFVSAMHATSFALPHMIKRPEGPSIFYVGSRMIRLGSAPGQQAYIASKMAIAGFAASVQQEVKDFGVRVVCLNVGLVSTDLGNKIPKDKKFMVVPGELQIQPEDIADAVAFTMHTDPKVSPVSFDICGMVDEYVDVSGGALKLSNL